MFLFRKWLPAGPKRSASWQLGQSQVARPVYLLWDRGLLGNVGVAVAAAAAEAAEAAEAAAAAAVWLAARPKAAALPAAVAGCSMDL